MNKSNNDFEDIARWRMNFCRELGIKIDDEQFFTDKIQTYGYREIVLQYLDHFIEDDGDKVRPNTTFEEIYNFYQLDQNLKNEALIDLQLFEQTFKVALVDALELYAIQLKTKKIKTNKDPKLKLENLLKEKYTLHTGRVIRRGDLKSRVRRIKENYLEPFDGFNSLHSEITPWVLIKEMSFGVACNFFFLLHHKQQAIILKRVFKNDLSLDDFEKIIESMRYFRSRAAHNYSLLIIKNNDDEHLYDAMYNSLLLLNNQEPAKRIKNSFRNIINKYLEKYSKEKNYLPSLDLLNRN